MSPPNGAELTTGLPAAPLALLQDLAYRQEPARGLGLGLPSQGALADVSALPLPIGVLLHFGLLRLDDWPVSAVSNDHAGTLESLTAAASPSSTRRVTKVPPEELQRLQRQSIQACRAISDLAHTAADDWKRSMTMLDIARCCAQLDRTLRERGLHVVVTASS